MSHLQRALLHDVPYPCLTCGINLSEGVLYCPPCWAQKVAQREARRVLPFDPSRPRRNPTVRYQITRLEETESGNDAASAEAPERILPTSCTGGPISGPEKASGDPEDGAVRRCRATAATWLPDEAERRARAEAGEPVIANMKSDLALIAWAKETGRLLRIDRRTPLGNPFRIGRDGDRDAVCEAYARHLAADRTILVPDLSGKVLACWCYPLRCHGEALIAARGGAA